ncbi:putative peptidoglycan binding protein [Salana multivorans]|uniref:Putative peptidoglycan binding protein n=1 Tax=Salana multivorans TaxID=120377 RepID=A0A3N2DDF7_9MICO|nr:M15 family metallopeptidase [Salana multivorans]ROR97777.1 putative peptidoglycan binding protein [Salana multivorans]ROR97856.1 putative peptidoglycan binding protein [Salana multivorans]
MSAPITPNGWAVVPDYGDPALGTLDAVAGRGNVLAGDVAAVLGAFCADFAREVEPIVKADSWGYAPRKQHGSDRWSNHASGTAVDLNASRRPEFRSTYTAAQKVAIRALLVRYPVLRWGGDWSPAELDEMHFEIAASPAVLATFAQTLGGGAMAAPRMTSPVQGYVSSRYGSRSGGFHAGLDIAGGGVSRTVRAAFAGTVERIVRGRARGQSASIGAVLAPGRSGNGVVVRNPDGERQLYGHVTADAGLKIGDNVGVGDRLGVTDLSGVTTGYHLHFEVWTARGATRNPEIDFRTFDVTPGAAPYVPAAPPAPAPSKPAPSAPTQQARDPKVLAWQQRANRYGKAGLVEDGVKGSKSLRWEAWVRQLQTALNRWKAVAPKLVVDGDYGAVTDNAVYQAQKANPARFGPKPDRVVGPKTVRALGIPAKPDVS